MSKAFRRGLVVGKFSPLHRGHELLIARASEACDEVLVLSYSKPEFPGCEQPRRERWLAALFPQVERLVLDDRVLAGLCTAAGLHARSIPRNDAPAHAQREFVGWLCLALLGKHVDAVFTSEAYGDGFAQDLQAYLHAHGNADSRVQHVCIDRDRSEEPISGTAVRADVHGQRRFLSPVVYADFVERVCLLGGESSGKTTLAIALAERLGTAWVPEYGRELWMRLAGKLEFAHMLEIARIQVEREREASRSANRWLVCDTSPLTTLLYCLDEFGRSDPLLDELSQRRYARVLLCAPDFEFVQDGSRRDAAFRLRQDAWYRRELGRRNIEFETIRGSPAERLEQALRVL